MCLIYLCLCDVCVKTEYDDESEKNAAQQDQQIANEDNSQLELPVDMNMEEENEEEQGKPDTDNGSGINQYFKLLLLFGGPAFYLNCCGPVGSVINISFWSVI